jgi:hypothetical protein
MYLNIWYIIILYLTFKNDVTYILQKKKVRVQLINPTNTTMRGLSLYKYI